MKIDINKIREDFPILNRKVNNKPLIYFDNAATSQKPQVVIDAISRYYQVFNANIHRGVHTLSQEATESYERARVNIRNHINAQKSHEVIFTSGSTHGINLVAHSMSEFVRSEDEIIVSAVEHHSNIVPWQMMCEKTGAKLKVIPMNDDGTLNIESYATLLSKKTKIVFCNHVSNALGTINPIKKIIDMAHSWGAVTLIDGAQACPHLIPDMAYLDTEFYVCSGHKIYAPTGTGFLYGKEEWLEKLPPYQGGGEMIEEVTFNKTTYAGLPHKFEAGTPNISGQIALATAIDYTNKIGFDIIKQRENLLLEHLSRKLQNIEGLKIYGNTSKKVPVISFNLRGLHHYDVGAILNQMSIAVRTGHHCAQPVMDFYKIPGTVRASLSFYNTLEEIDIFIDGLLKVKKMLTY